MAAARAAVDCVRKHGMPGVPDPVLSANGQVTVLGYTAADVTPKARSSCAAQLRLAEATSDTLPNVSASDMQALLRWAAYTAIPPLLFPGALAAALTFGLAAGLYPAVRAARLSPTDALRGTT